jgi:hypothetical protein
LIGRQTDHRNLDLNKFHHDVVKGKAGGKIIWQPRILCWYTDKLFSGEKLPEPYEGKSLPDIYRELGCSNRNYDFNGCFRTKENPRIKRFNRKLSETEIEHVIQCPKGEITCITQKVSSSPHHLMKKWWIENEEDLKVQMWIEANRDWYFDYDFYNEMNKVWGDLGAPTVFIPRVNVQRLYIDLMGVENAIYALTDYPELVEEYFKVIDEDDEKLIKAINESPIDIINFGDNVHSGTLSPYFFEKYVLPSYQKRTELLHKADKFTYAHWDGDTKPLLKYAKQTGLDGIEAITPKPQGDVTIEEMKEGLGDELFLIDGISAVLFDDMFPKEELIEQTEKLIKLFAPKLILGISDEISSTGNIERIKLVGKIVDDYNARITER